MRKLSLSDFRAVRQILTGADFAVSEGPDYDELRSAMVDPDVWRSIQELPDTVSIATSGLTVLSWPWRISFMVNGSFESVSTSTTTL